MLQTSTPPASELQRSVTLLVKALSTTEPDWDAQAVVALSVLPVFPLLGSWRDATAKLH
jgi:hypothetical protein